MRDAVGEEDKHPGLIKSWTMRSEYSEKSLKSIMLMGDRVLIGSSLCFTKIPLAAV